MTELRRDLPPLPPRMRHLPLDDRGYPVPWFVGWHDGKPDFRVIRAGGFVEAVRKKRCWLCGDVMGRYGAFVIGPMCAVNRVSSEPPSHRECADFAVRACPFLVRPGAKRREAKMPEGTRDPAGLMIERNPGVALLWVSRAWKPFEAGNGYLIDVGEPVEAIWWREGRLATRDEVSESIRTGIPVLQDEALKEGPSAQAAFLAAYQRALHLLPVA